MPTKAPDRRPTKWSLNHRQIRKLREGLGYNQAQFARRLGVSRQALSRWERGDGAPQLHKLFRIAEITGVHLPSLLVRSH